MIFFLSCTLRTPSPRVRGEGGVRGPLDWARNCGAQNRGEAPSPSLAEPVIGPATSGRTRWLARPLPARRGEVKWRRVLVTPARTSQADGDGRIADSVPPLASLFRRLNSLQES